MKKLFGRDKPKAVKPAGDGPVEVRAISLFPPARFTDLAAAEPRGPTTRQITPLDGRAMGSHLGDRSPPTPPSTYPERIADALPHIHTSNIPTCT